MENLEQGLPEDHIPQSADEAESLIQQWQSQESPETANTAQNAAAEESAAITPKLEKYVIKRGGKEIELELTPEKRLNLLQQGYDYSENQRQVRQEREAIARERQYIESRKKDLERIKQYQEVEEYTKKDPQWWEHVRAEYARRLQEQGGNASLPPAIMEKIDGVTEFVSQLKEERTLEARAKEDGELDSVINDYRAKHADLDWSAKDEQGRDLERQIIDHALEMGISKPKGFIAAANNYLFDKHVERAKLGAKAEVGKTIQKQAKLGLGPVTPNRTLSKAPVKALTSKSWEELNALAQKELGEG